MKKFSFLFAVLAIVVAVGSAFTSKSKVLTTTYAIFGATQDAVNVSPSVDPAQAYANKISDAFLKVTTTSTSFATEKAAWNASHGIGQAKVRCNQNDTDQICGSAVSYDADVAVQDRVYTLIDFEAGDYTLVP